MNKRPFLHSYFFRFLLFSSCILVMITNDSSSREVTLPLGPYNLVERDWVFLPLLIGCLFHINEIRKAGATGIFASPIISILAIYVVWGIFGLFQGNSLKTFGYAFRQAIYLLIYFPLLAYLNTTATGLQEIRNLLKGVLYVSVLLTIVLSVLFLGKTDVNYRGIFVWIDVVNVDSNVPRVLAAGALYFPFVIFMSLGPFWISDGKRHSPIMLMALLGLLLTFTRSYWLGCIVGIMFFVVVYLRFRRDALHRIKLNQVIGLILLLLVTIIMFSEQLALAILSRIQSSQDFESAAIAYRLLEAEAFVQKISESVFIGHGTGATVNVLSGFEPNDYIDTSFSHNSYLIYLLYFGIVGTILVLSNFLRILIRLIRYSFLLHKTNGIVLLATASSFVCLLALSLTASQITFAGGYFQLGVLLGISDHILRSKAISSSHVTHK